jgi:hypothetical protein
MVSMSTYSALRKERNRSKRVPDSQQFEKNPLSRFLRCLPPFVPEGKAASEPGPAGNQRAGACLKTAGGEPNAQANAQHISHPGNRRPERQWKCAPQWRG